MTIVELALRLLLGAVFLLSAIPKLRHPKGFTLTVLQYEVLPPSLGMLYGRLLPPLEFFLALLLLTGTAIRLAAVVVSLLIVSFIVAIGINLARGRDLDCGCFGAGGNRRIGPGLLLQDLGLLTASAVAAALGKGWLVPASWSLVRVGGLSSVATPVTLTALAAATAACTLVLPRSRRWGRRWEEAFSKRRRLHAKTTVD